MAEDYYKILGVSRNASQDEIQKAYRKLARKYHPDLNPDDETAKKKFQEVQKAFDVLNDPSKREMYDRYGSSFESVGAGAEGGGPRTYTWTSGGGGGGFEDVDFSQFFGERFGTGGGPSGGFADIFSQFTRAGTAGRRRAPRRGADLQYDLQVPFRTAVLGGEVHLTVDRDGKTDTIAVRIPPGIEDGQKMRLRGQGQPAPAGGEPGDLLLTIHIAPHPYYTRRGKNLYVKLPVRVSEAILGAKVDVPTPKGTVTLKVPPGTSSGARLRIKGHGVAPKSGPPGDLFAEVQIVVPKKVDAEARELIEKFAQYETADPRRDLVW